MKRKWNNHVGPPDEDSARVAAALANTCDSDTLQSFLDIATILNRFGGQAYIGAYREKFDRFGNIVKPEEVGKFETIGFAYYYEHVASLTNAPREKDAKFGEEMPIENPDYVEVGDLSEEEIEAIEAANAAKLEEQPAAPEAEEPEQVGVDAS